MTECDIESSSDNYDPENDSDTSNSSSTCSTCSSSSKSSTKSNKSKSKNENIQEGEPSKLIEINIKFWNKNIFNFFRTPHQEEEEYCFMEKKH